VFNSKAIAYYSLVALGIGSILAPQVYADTCDWLVSNANQSINKAAWISRNLDSRETEVIYKIKLDSSTYEEFGAFKDNSGETMQELTDLSQNNRQTGVYLDEEVKPMAHNQLQGYEGCLLVTVRNNFVIYPGLDVNGKPSPLSKKEKVTGFKRCK
jgi:hypothetical protein